jgi:WhiB family redox-sensing transcriptional regulator
VSARPGGAGPPALPAGVVLPVLDGAACKGQDAALWFPRPGRSTAQARAVATAKAVCAGCPVRAACLEWAVQAGERAGIWGGATARERGHLSRTGKKQQRSRRRADPDRAA